MPALALAELSATAAVALACCVPLYLLIVAVVALAATFRPDPLRRADARRVPTALLAVLPRKRVVGRRPFGTAARSRVGKRGGDR